MFKKVIKAAVEGKLLIKALHFLLMLPGRILKKLDWLLGCAVRYFFAVSHKVNSKQIMFISFQGDYTCNPKYIAEKLRQEHVKCSMVFSAREKSMIDAEAFPEDVRRVEQYTDAYYKAIAKSKIIIVNSVEFLKQPTYLKKDQVLIETWHGSLGIKRFDASVNSGRAWVAAAKRCGRRCDYIISNSEFEDHVYRTSFWKKTPILRYGHPRNDILFENDLSMRDKVLAAIRLYESKQIVPGTVQTENCAVQKNNTEKLPEEGIAASENPVEGNPGEATRFLLYAPTFRDDHGLQAYLKDFTTLRETLETKFGGKWKILVRLHPTVRKKAAEYYKQLRKQGVIDMTAYPDIQELMIVCDIAVTDYSSWIYDFVLTRRPGFLFVADLNRYGDERGFYYPLSATPFPIAATEAKLNQNIMEFDEESYRRNVEAFLLDKGCIEDGHASERVVEKIREIMGAAE